MRWLHKGVDHLYVALMHWLVPPLFRRGTDSPPFGEHLAAVKLRVPPLTSGGHHRVAARTLVGGLQAGLRVRPGAHQGLPVLIWHHGLGEIPSHHTFRGIFPRRGPVEAHLVAVRAPFHRSHIDCMRGLARLDRFLAMGAVSVALIETVRLAFAAQGACGSLVAGISLGGFVTLLHHLAFGTASRYAPVLAGPDLAHCLLATPCRGFVSAQALEEPERLQARLDLREAFGASDANRVHPLLARHDLWMPLAHHQAAYAAAGIAAPTIERGHMTGSWAFAAIRAHLLGLLRDPMLWDDRALAQRPLL